MRSIFEKRGLPHDRLPVFLILPALAMNCELMKPGFRPRNDYDELKPLIIEHFKGSSIGSEVWVSRGPRLPFASPRFEPRALSYA